MNEPAPIVLGTATRASRSRPRGDAVRNRAHILEVSRQVFRTEGLDVSMAEIARRSEVGIATLFRHFDSKNALIVEVFTQPMLECADAIDRATEPGTAWLTLETTVREICGLQWSDRGFAAVLVRSFATDSGFFDATKRMTASFETLLIAAKVEGALRREVELLDIVALLIATSGLVGLGETDAVGLSDRLTDNVLRSLHV